jgi:RNA polymerase sigma factor (sigma-70 family)
MNPLTEEQRKLVEENHNLIFKYAIKNNIDIDEYYDLLAIGMCKAALVFDTTKGAFSTVAYHCMGNEMNMHRRHMNRMYIIPNNMIFSYDAYMNNDCKDGENFLSTISSDIYSDEVAIGNVMLSELITTLTVKEKRVMALLIDGYTQSEIAEEMNCSRQNVWKYVSRIRKKMFDYLKG